MINLKDYIKTKRIENKEREKIERKEYKDNIIKLETLVFEAIMHNKTYFCLRFTSDLIKITDKLSFDRDTKCDNQWEFRIKMNLLSLWLLKREVKKVKKWKIK